MASANNGSDHNRKVWPVGEYETSEPELFDGWEANPTVKRHADPESFWSGVVMFDVEAVRRELKASFFGNEVVLTPKNNRSYEVKVTGTGVRKVPRFIVAWEIEAEDGTVRDTEEALAGTPAADCTPVLEPGRHALKIQLGKKV